MLRLLLQLIGVDAAAAAANTRTTIASARWNAPRSLEATALAAGVCSVAAAGERRGEGVSVALADGAGNGSQLRGSVENG